MQSAIDWKRSTEVRHYRIKMTKLAEQDLEKAGNYIAYIVKNPTAARNTVMGIQNRIRSLIPFPERNVLVEDELLASLGVRKDYYKNYEIYYIVEGGIVYILRILHRLEDSRIQLYRTMGL